MRIKLTSIVLVLFCASLARAADKIALRMDIPVGMAWTFSQSESGDVSSSQKMNGQQQQMQQKYERKISGKVEVLESNSGRPSSLRVTFDRDCPGSMEGNGQKQDIPFALAGKSVTIKIGADGGITHDAGQINPQDEQELQSIAMGDESFLPAQPVAIGETWAPDMDEMARKWHLDLNQNKVKIELKLRDVKEAGPDRIAVVDLNMNMSGEPQQGLKGERNTIGTAVVDVRTGKILAVGSTSKSSMSGTTQQQGQDGNTYVIEMSSQGTETSKSEVHFADSAGPAPAPSPMPRPAPNPAPNPTPPASGALTFSDPNMTFSFSGSSGTIVMGNQQFPAKIARWDGTNLAGTFESDGSTFDFTGQLNGDTLTFKTGSSQYQLKAAAPKKKNPLEK